MWIRSQGQENTLEQEMETRASVLAWEIHGQKSLVGHSSRGCKRVGHNLATKQQQAMHECFSFSTFWPTLVIPSFFNGPFSMHHMIPHCGRSSFSKNPLTHSFSFLSKPAILPP